MFFVNFFWEAYCRLAINEKGPTFTTGISRNLEELEDLRIKAYEGVKIDSLGGHP